jgi:hypothetical protein
MEQTTPSKPSYRSYVWRYRLCENLRHELVTDANHKGSINNSDLKLAVTVVQPDGIATQSDVAETTVASLHDNTPTVFWQKKGSSMIIHGVYISWVYCTIVYSTGIWRLEMMLMPLTSRESKAIRARFGRGDKTMSSKTTRVESDTDE